ERVLAVAVVEGDFTADGGNTDRVSVAADAGHDAFEQVPGARVVERAEPQRVHERDRTRAHGKDVANDATDTGRRTLVRLNGRRIIVAPEAPRDREPAPPGDDARPFTGTDEHPGRLRREPTQVDLGRLVGAVLRPHHRVHGELELVRLPP